jgi:hypothetical protein
MTSATRLARLVRVVTLPESRGVIVAAARSQAVRDIRQHAVHDRGALVRDLRTYSNARALVQSAVRHPATRELANAGLMFLPLRYLPVGWAATWVANRVRRRHLAAPAAVADVLPPGRAVALRGAAPRWQAPPGPAGRGGR